MASAYERGFADGWKAGFRVFDPDDAEGYMGEPVPRPIPKRKRKGKKNPALSRAMKRAYRISHKQNGDFRKGWDRSRMLKYAHKIK